MIQCVGSRVPERPNCSRICCSVAVKNALKLKDIHPSAEVTICYRDMRTYGFQEQYYSLARKQGVIFVPYDLDAKPELTVNNGNLELTVKDRILEENITISPDLVVLSTAVVPHENEQLAKMLKVPLTADKFFLEAHMKLRPVDFATDGVFLAGMAHFPKTSVRRSPRPGQPLHAPQQLWPKVTLLFFLPSLRLIRPVASVAGFVNRFAHLTPSVWRRPKRGKRPAPSWPHAKVAGFAAPVVLSRR